MWDGTRVLLPPSFAWGNRVSSTTPNYAPPNIGFPSQNVASSMDVSVSLTKVWGRHTHQDRVLQPVQQQAAGAGGRRRRAQPELPAGHRRAPIPATPRSGSPTRRSAASARMRRGRKGVEGEYIYYNTEGYVQDNWKVNSNADARLRRPVGAPDAAVRRARPGVELLHRAVEPRGGARAVCRGLRQRRVSLHGHEPAGDESVDRPVPGSEHHAGDRHDRAQQRQRDERAGAGRPGDPALDLPSARPRRGAAVRRGVRPDGTPADRASRRRRPVLRSSVGQRRVRAGPEPAGAKERHAPLRPAADARRWRPRHRSAVVAHRSTSTTARCPSSWQWNAGMQIALPWSHRGRRRRMSASTATTSSRASTSTRSTSATAFLRAEPGSDAGADHAGRHVAADRSDARVPRLQRRSRRTSAAAGSRTTRCSSRSTAASATVCRSGSTTRSASRLTAASAARLQHNPDGTVTYRADQAEADELLPDAADAPHDEGQLRVGSAGSESDRRRRCARSAS